MLNSTKTSSASPILHVDDDPLMLELIRDRLGAEGREVVGVSDPREAVQALSDHGCRLALLDIDMPHIDGLELLQRIKARDAGVQVIMLTGIVTQAMTLSSLHHGAEYCLFKPITDFDLLLSTIHEVERKNDRWKKTLYELRLRKQQELEMAL